MTNTNFCVLLVVSAGSTGVGKAKRKTIFFIFSFSQMVFPFLHKIEIYWIFLQFIFRIVLPVVYSYRLHPFHPVKFLPPETVWVESMPLSWRKTLPVLKKRMRVPSHGIIFFCLTLLHLTFATHIPFIQARQSGNWRQEPPREKENVAEKQKEKASKARNFRVNKWAFIIKAFLLL